MRATTIFLLAVMANLSCLAQITVTPNGLKYGDKDYTVIETTDTSANLIASVEEIIKTKCQSTSIVVSRTKADQLIISDLVQGFTKTDKAAGSAYLFDLSYRVVMDFKEGRIRVNTPIISIGSQDRFLDNNNQFVLTMGFSGKNDVWSNDEKKFFIYNQKGKLIETSTKNKLEGLFNGLTALIIDNLNQSNDW